jgi:uncharacterized protein YqiB (DUF1249 family)
MHLPDEKAQLNRFLGELLSYCLAEGRAAGPVFTVEGALAPGL